MKHLPALLIGFIAGTVATCVVLAISMNLSRPAPELRPPVSIKVTLHTWIDLGIIGGETAEIPREELDFAFRLMTPEKHQRYGAHEFVHRIVAEAEITHADGSKTNVLIRDTGVNPALVTIDGRNYFSARNDPDVRAGAMQLIRLVHDVTNSKKAPQEPKP